MRTALLFLAATTYGATYQLTDAQAALKKHCAACHSGKSPSGGFAIAKAFTATTLDDTRLWGRMLQRVREGEMPPPTAGTLPLDVRDRFVSYVDAALHTAACADGISPGPSLLRRLNRSEYASTVRDLLGIHINAGHALPADGAGGEGFDNAAETLFLSPIHAEKYMEAAKLALDYALKDPRSRTRFMVKPTAEMPPPAAARKIIEDFLPRAFRRPARAGEAGRIMKLYEAARGRGESFDDGIAYALRGVLMSPHFLFRLEDANPAPEPRLLGDHALATRLSYFLWGSMPDDKLTELASAGKLQDAAVLTEQIARMLKDTKAHESWERFVEQWLSTRELGRDIKPDAKLFPAYYDAEIQSGLRYETIIFFQEMLAENLPLTDLIDSNWTVLSDKLQRHYNIKLEEKLRQQPKKVTLPPGTHRGGLLGMGAILAVSSMPNRTSPVLRGKWILDALLGTPPPPPPPNVPPLTETTTPEAATVKERLVAHRANAACAACHGKIDPLGFGLENFDVLGRWRSEDSGKPVDAKGQWPDGTAFDGPDELKRTLMARKDQVMRNLAGKMLGYALGRGLTREESCTVEKIVASLQAGGYQSQTLVREIVLSIPFRYQAGTNIKAPVPGTTPAAPTPATSAGPTTPRAANPRTAAPKAATTAAPTASKSGETP